MNSPGALIPGEFSRRAAEDYKAGVERRFRIFHDTSMVLSGAGNTIEYVSKDLHCFPGFVFFDRV